MSRKLNSQKSYKKLEMDEKYLQKDVCIACAEQLVTEHNWTQVTAEQLAKEIYGHAYVCYHWQWMSKLPIANRMIYSHAVDGIDVTDKVDTFQVVWEWMWKYR